MRYDNEGNRIIDDFGLGKYGYNGTAKPAYTFL
jgi:hypothetical protein